MSLTTMQPSSPSQNVPFSPSTTSFQGKETGIRCTFPFPRPLHLQRRQKWPFDEGRGGTTTGGGARAVLIIGKGGKEAAGGRKKRSKVLRNIWFKSREQHCESKRKAPRGDTGGGEKNREKSRCSSSVCTRCTQFSKIPQEPFRHTSVRLRRENKLHYFGISLLFFRCKKELKQRNLRKITFGFGVQGKQDKCFFKHSHILAYVETHAVRLYCKVFVCSSELPLICGRH